MISKKGLILSLVSSLVLTALLVISFAEQIEEVSLMNQLVGYIFIFIVTWSAIIIIVAAANEGEQQ